MSAVSEIAVQAAAFMERAAYSPGSLGHYRRVWGQFGEYCEASGVQDPDRESAARFCVAVGADGAERWQVFHRRAVSCLFDVAETGRFSLRAGRGLVSMPEVFTARFEAYSSSLCPVFANRAGEQLGRAGAAHILARCAHAAHTERPDLVPEKVSPHMLRHSKAMHLLENGVNLIYIRDILGHASIVTTEVYAKANPEMKRLAVEAAAARTLGPSRYDQASRQDLLTWLRQTI